MDFLLSKIIFIGAVLLPPLLCFIIAKLDSRNSIRWLLYGLFFGIFAVIYLVFYTKKDDNDKIAPRAMVLLGILMTLMAISVYETFFGLLVR
jgi:hypothetical protein